MSIDFFSLLGVQKTEEVYIFMEKIEMQIDEFMIYC